MQYHKGCMNKKLLCIFIMLAFCRIPGVLAQEETGGKVTVDREIKGELIGGVNISQVDGDEVYGFKKVSPCIGVGGILPLGHRFSLSLEILYDAKGSYQKYPPSPAGDSLQLPYYSLNWSYLTAPIMVHFEDRNTWTFGLGFSWGRMVSYKEKEWNISQDWERAVITHKTKNDFAVIADLRFRVWKHLKFNIRYSYSMAPVRTREYTNPVTSETWTRKQYNNVITLRLLYYFNEKYLPDRFSFKKNKDKKKRNKKEE